MNMFKKQLRLPTGFSGIKKAVSATNLSDKAFTDLESHPHNLTLDHRTVKSKTQVTNSQDLAELLDQLYKAMSDNSNENFISDDLPASLDTEWLSKKYSTDGDPRIQKKNSAIIEMLTTELNYLNQMQFLLDVSSKVFSDVQQKYFPYVSCDDVFLNLGEIYEVNYQFWTKYLYPSFETAKGNHDFISCSSWKEGFNQICAIFFPYQVYCSRMTQCQKYVQSLERDKYFLQFLQWYSRTEQSNRESLTDFIAKPFQRLTKYKLLLMTIMGYSDEQSERDDLADMINSVNSFLKQVEWKISMSQISVRIDPIDFVEPPTEDLMELCAPYRHVNLTAPIRTNNGDILRQLIKDGTFRMKEARMKAAEVSLLLFTDLILICQKIKNFEVDRIKVIKPIIPLNRLTVISPLPGSLVLRVLDNFGCIASMYLLMHDNSITHDWIEAIEDAQCSIKTMSIGKSCSDIRRFPVLTVNVTNASPFSEQSSVEKEAVSPLPLFNSHLGSFQNLYESGSFTRSKFLSSPVTRRRLNSVSPSKNRAESLHESSLPHNQSAHMSRSISEYHSKSQLSILEDECDQNFGTLNSSVSSIDILPHHLQRLSESEEDLNNTANTNHLNGEAKTKTIDTSTFNDRRTDKLSEIRAYGSMMNLSSVNI